MIERAANAKFAGLGMQAVAELDGTSVGELAARIDKGYAWVETDDHDAPVAFLLISIVDGNGHVDQVAAHPSLATKGAGKRLIDTVVSWAKANAVSALTLTTFVDVPWNAPYYERLGFRRLADGQPGPALAAMLDHNDRTVLGRWPRVAMKKDV